MAFQPYFRTLILVGWLVVGIAGCSSADEIDQAATSTTSISSMSQSLEERSQPSVDTTALPAGRDLLDPDELVASDVELWTGRDPGIDSATAGFLVNRGGCIGLLDQPDAPLLPLKIGLNDGQYVEITSNGRAIDFSGTVIEFGTHVFIGGVVRGTVPEDGGGRLSDFQLADIEAAPAPCDLVVGEPKHYFDSGILVPPEPVVYRGPGGQ